MDFTHHRTHGQTDRPTDRQTVCPWPVRVCRSLPLSALANVLMKIVSLHHGMEKKGTAWVSHMDAKLGICKAGADAPFEHLESMLACAVPLPWKRGLFLVLAGPCRAS